MSSYVVYQTATGGMTSAMQVLLDASIGLNYEVERLGSPHGIAILCGKLDLVRFLLTRGADPNNQYAFPPITLLHQTALLQSTSLTRLLVGHGANVQDSKALQGALTTRLRHH